MQLLLFYIVQRPRVDTVGDPIAVMTAPSCTTVSASHIMHHHWCKHNHAPLLLQAAIVTIAQATAAQLCLLANEPFSVNMHSSCVLLPSHGLLHCLRGCNNIIHSSKYLAHVATVQYIQSNLGNCNTKSLRIGLRLAQLFSFA